MTTTKKPQDYKKAGGEAPSFEFDGQTYTFEKPLKAKHFRKYRHLEGDDGIWAILEEVAGEEALAAIDEMTMPEFKEFIVDVIGGSMGES